MHSTQNPKQADPHDVYVTAPDVVPAAHADAGLYGSARDPMSLPPDPQARMGYETSAGPSVPPVDTTFRAAEVGNIRVLRGRRSMGVRAMRGVIGFLLAVCVGIAGALWQSHGDLATETVQQAAQQMLGRWMPKFIATRLSGAENPSAADQPASSTDQAAATTTTTATAAPQPASVAQTTPASAAADAAASAADSAQLQSMAQDLASAKQEIEQLKASVAQLKAGQDQMSREVARVTDTRSSDTRPPEPAPRPRVALPPPRPVILGAPPRPLAAPVRRPPPPPPPLRSSQAAPIPLQAAPPPVARQPEPLPVAPPPPQQGEQMSSVLRPPMPVP
jgi:hypothetical protein